jgi:hypothetical protein
VRDGVLVISTPNPAEYVTRNDFHVREYSPEELDALLAEHFTTRQRLYQHNWLTSAVVDEASLRAGGAERSLGVELYKTAQLEPGHELYSVMVCGEVARLPAGTGVLSGVHEAHRLEANRLRWQERALAAEDRARSFDERASEAERLQRAWEARAREAERQAAEARSALEAVVESRVWRATAPIRGIGARLRRR